MSNFMVDNRKKSESSSGSEYSDDIKIYHDDKYKLGDDVIVRQSKKKDDTKKIIMFRGRIVGFDYKKCKKPMWGTKDSRNDFKEKYYCIQLKDYRTNDDNFETIHDIPGDTNRITWAHKDTIYDYFKDDYNYFMHKDSDFPTPSERMEKQIKEKLFREKMRSSPPPQQFLELEKEIDPNRLQFDMNMTGGRRKRKKRRKRTKKRGRKTRKKKREKRKTKKLPNGKDDRCAPKKKGDRLPYTCYTKSSLHKLKTIWNLRHPDAKILSNDPKEIWNSLKINFGNTCKRESCWLNQQFVKNKIDKSILKNTFRPSRPKQWKKNPDEWLNSVDIMKFMKQYEHLHKDFDFMGPSPIDYDTHLVSDECVWEELCKFNLKNTINNGKRKIGIIFNLDPHFKGGSHWVAMFINTNDKCIYYFDSYGEEIPDGLYKFVKKIQNQSSNIGKQYTFKENRKRHQYSNTECGMFCLHFIRSMILHNNWKELTTKKLTDREMLRLRKVYYNP